MFHTNLKNLRMKSGLSQKKVAEYLNITPQSISKWEKGESQPSIDYLPVLAECLNCNINDFFAPVVQESAHNSVLKELLEMTGKILSDEEDYEKVDMNAYISAHPDSVNEAIAFCKKIMKYRTLYPKTLQGILGCPVTETQSFIDLLIKHGILEKLDIENAYFVIKVAADQFIVFLKIKQVLYERFVDDSIDCIEVLLNKLDD